MIRSFCDVLRNDIAVEINARRDSLEAGTADDSKVRGEIWAFRTTLEMIDALEERARRADAGSDDDMF